jgi:hypothetical protein
MANESEALALDRWLAAADAIRPTCENLPAFDALIAGQKEKAAGMLPGRPS